MTEECAPEKVARAIIASTAAVRATDAWEWIIATGWVTAIAGPVIGTIIAFVAACDLPGALVLGPAHSLPTSIFCSLSLLPTRYPIHRPDSAVHPLKPKSIAVRFPSHEQSGLECLGYIPNCDSAAVRLC